MPFPYLSAASYAIIIALLLCAYYLYYTVFDDGPTFSFQERLKTQFASQEYPPVPVEAQDTGTFEYRRMNVTGYMVYRSFAHAHVHAPTSNIYLSMFPQPSIPPNGAPKKPPRPELSKKQQ